jgi:hypothetical protein
MNMSEREDVAGYDAIDDGDTVEGAGAAERQGDDRIVLEENPEHTYAGGVAEDWSTSLDIADAGDADASEVVPGNY